MALVPGVVSPAAYRCHVPDRLQFPDKATATTPLPLPLPLLPAPSSSSG